ncbi:hypothetical protein SAMN05444166_1080 [Singulisphaera sp. GP187]|uniref:hypothetical protein n=1 Tax=Singulisphaera sp. GP187 TaxID=1882752 RepID=UPI000928A58A|nr:hypothetical protein [Singulisphaera sp. GP187]SIN81928.1 hypothetical protein SAMN05444166_1080 [Singulisphaera sp. GP187]
MELRARENIATLYFYSACVENRVFDMALSYYVRMLFLLYGVRIAGVINQYHHFRKVTGCGHSYQDCSKYPPAFGIDLLVDESEGVWLESQRHGFKMVLVRPDDNAWAKAVRAMAQSM